MSTSSLSLAIKGVGQDPGYCLGPVSDADGCHKKVGWPDTHSTAPGWVAAEGAMAMEMAIEEHQRDWLL